MSFKESVEADNLGVSLNTEEFADKHTIKFDEKTYEDISVAFIKVKQSERKILQNDHMQGVYQLTAKAVFGRCKDHNARH